MEYSQDIYQHGVKGMHWGQRKSGSTAAGPTPVGFKERPAGKLLKTTGGQRHGAHEDAIKTAIARQTAKKSTTDALSTKDLQELVNRMNLEQQYSKLMVSNPHNQLAVTQFIKKLSGAASAANKVHAFANSPGGKAIRVAVKAKTGK